VNVVEIDLKLNYLCCVLPVQAKFGLSSNEQVSLVLDIDGCDFDAEDLIDMVSLQQPFMLLRNSETWTKVSSLDIIKF